MVFQKRLTHFLVWVTCDSLLRKRMVLHSHTHQPIKCKHAFFKYPQVKLWNDTCLQKSPRGGVRVSLSGPRTVSSQWLCPLNRGVQKEGFQCGLTYYRTCCFPIRGLWRKLFSENIFLSTTTATLREEASVRYEEAGVICHYFSRGEEGKNLKIKTNINIT